MNEDYMILATCSIVLINQDSTPELKNSIIVLAIKTPISDQIHSALFKENKVIKWSDYEKLQEKQYKAKAHIEVHHFNKIKLSLKESMQSCMRTCNIFSWGETPKCHPLSPSFLSFYHILYLFTIFYSSIILH